MLSILIPIYNFDIRKLVSDLEAAAQQLEVPYEILCFDDGSNADFRRLHQPLNERPHIHYRELPENLGRSRIRNLLAAEARYSYLLFMDCDSGLTSSDFLSNYLALAAPNRVVVGKRMYQAQPPQEAERYFRWLYGIQREQRSAGQRNTHPYEAFCTHHFLCPKAVFDQLQFDPNLRQYGHEDTQFGLDLEHIGIEVRHTDNPLLHIDLEPVDEFLPKTLRGIENLVYLQAKGSGIKTRLSDFHARLQKWGAAPLLALLYPRWKMLLEKNLRSDKPKLWVFDLYKLSYLAYFSRLRQKDQI
ncbi:MAG: glycosyltransferase [Phaeodactylibacter sp.]|nr:glycosyltransferase [Phaeodactylibacter sp.]